MHSTGSKPTALVWQHKLVHGGRVIAEGSESAMARLSTHFTGSFIALSWRKSMLGQPWKLASIPRTSFDSSTLLNSGHNSTL